MHELLSEVLGSDSTLVLIGYYATLCLICFVIIRKKFFVQLHAADVCERCDFVR